MFVTRKKTTKKISKKTNCWLRPWQLFSDSSGPETLSGMELLCPTGGWEGPKSIPQNPNMQETGMSSTNNGPPMIARTSKRAAPVELSESGKCQTATH